MSAETIDLDAGGSPHLLLWHRFTRDSRPPKTTCVFSDGICTYWVGWWSTHGGPCIYVPSGRGHHSKLSDAEFQRITHWAHLGNLIGQGVLVQP
jgi:hypothetical protein